MKVFQFLARGQSTGLCVCVAVLFAVSSEVAESKSETQDVGTCGVGAVLNAGQYCSHKEGDNDFRFTVAGGEACINGTLGVGIQMEVSACAESDKLHFLDFLASERSGQWTIRSLPGSPAPAKEKEPATRNPPPPSPPQHPTTQGNEAALGQWKAPWADPDFSQIDYGLPVFRKYHKWSDEIFGWWILGQDEATDVRIAINISAVKGPVPYMRMQETLRVQCRKDNIEVALYSGKPVFYLDAPLVTYRFGNSSAIDEVWEMSGDRWAIGVGGGKALEIVRKMRLHEGSELFIGARSEPDDELKEIAFSLLGTRKMVRTMAKHCPELANGAE